MKRYQVMQRQGTYLDIEGEFRANPGDQVWVYADEQTKVKGLVTGRERQVWAPTMDEKFIPRWVELVRVAFNPPPVQILVSPSFFVGTKPGLVSCVAQGYYQRPGQLQWTLYYLGRTGQTAQALIQGDDRNTPSQIEVSVPGWFPPGVYQLEAVLYHSNGAVWKQDRRLWYAPHSVGYLGTGHPLDRRLPLFA